jgi:single-strand DNA-binding protein
MVAITVYGNLVADPELRFTQNGLPVANFTVAVNKRVKNEAGQYEDGDASFYDVTVWRQLAEDVAVALTKGNRVIVTGTMEQRTWEATDGTKRSKHEITAEEVGRSVLWASKDAE